MFTLKIETDSAAFGENEAERAIELVRILAEVTIAMSYGDTDGNCHDYNGNKVGEWKIKG